MILYPVFPLSNPPGIYLILIVSIATSYCCCCSLGLKRWSSCYFVVHVHIHAYRASRVSSCTLLLRASSGACCSFDNLIQNKWCPFFWLCHRSVRCWVSIGNLNRDTSLSRQPKPPASPQPAPVRGGWVVVRVA